MSTSPPASGAHRMQLEITGSSTEPTVRIEGDVDLASVPRLRAELTQLVDGGARRITLDLEEVEFIDSSGLGVLVGALRLLQDTNGGRVIVERAQDSVRKVFEITGLGPMFGLAPR